MAFNKCWNACYGVVYCLLIAIVLSFFSSGNASALPLYIILIEKEGEFFTLKGVYKKEVSKPVLNFTVKILKGDKGRGSHDMSFKANQNLTVEPYLMDFVINGKEGDSISQSQKQCQVCEVVVEGSGVEISKMNAVDRRQVFYFPKAYRGRELKPVLVVLNGSEPCILPIRKQNALGASYKFVACKETLNSDFAYFVFFMGNRRYGFLELPGRCFVYKTYTGYSSIPNELAVYHNGDFLSWKNNAVLIGQKFKGGTAELSGLDVGRGAALRRNLIHPVIDVPLVNEVSKGLDYDVYWPEEGAHPGKFCVHKLATSSESLPPLTHSAFNPKKTTRHLEPREFSSSYFSYYTSISSIPIDLNADYKLTVDDRAGCDSAIFKFQANPIPERKVAWAQDAFTVQVTCNGYMELLSRLESERDLQKVTVLPKEKQTLQMELPEEIRSKYIVTQAPFAGVQSKVFRCIDRDNHCIYAIRVDKDQNPPRRQEQVDNEKKILELIKSERPTNIVRVFDVWQISGAAKLVVKMEYCEKNLQQLLPASGFSPEELKGYLKPIMFGLGWLHSKRIIHRDLKATNFLISHDGQLKLADFGCAQQLESDGYTVLTTGCQPLLGFPVDYVGKYAGVMALIKSASTPGCKGYSVELCGLPCLIFNLRIGTSLHTQQKFLELAKVTADKTVCDPSVAGLRIQAVFYRWLHASKDSQTSEESVKNKVRQVYRKFSATVNEDEVDLIYYLLSLATGLSNSDTAFDILNKHQYFKI